MATKELEKNRLAGVIGEKFRKYVLTLRKERPNLASKLKSRYHLSDEALAEWFVHVHSQFLRVAAYAECESDGDWQFAGEVNKLAKLITASSEDLSPYETFDETFYKQHHCGPKTTEVVSTAAIALDYPKRTQKPRKISTKKPIKSTKSIIADKSKRNPSDGNQKPTAYPILELDITPVYQNILNDIITKKTYGALYQCVMTELLTDSEVFIASSKHLDDVDID